MLYDHTLKLYLSEKYMGSWYALSTLEVEANLKSSPLSLYLKMKGKIFRRKFAAVI